MAITYVTASAVRTLTNLSTSASATVDVGSGSDRLLVAYLFLRGNITNVTGITYAGTNLTLATSVQHATANLKTLLYYLAAPAAGSNTLSVTFDAQQNQTEIHAFAFNGVDQSAPLDQTATAQGNSASPSANITPTSNNQAVVGGIVHEDTVALTTGSGETAVFNQDNGAWVVSTSYVIQTTATTQAVDWTAAAANDFTLVAASFKEAAGGGVVVTPSAVSAVAATVDPTVVLGSLTLTPAAGSAVAATVDPTVVLDLSITPGPVSAVAATVSPTVVLGSLSLTPQAANAVTSIANPSVIGGTVQRAKRWLSTMWARSSVPGDVGGQALALALPEPLLVEWVEPAPAATPAPPATKFQSQWGSFAMYFTALLGSTVLAIITQDSSFALLAASILTTWALAEGKDPPDVV